MSPTVVRSLHACRIHCHKEMQALSDYTSLFRAISKIEPKLREERINDRVVALPLFVIDKNYVYITAYEGEIGLSPLLYDTDSTNERVGSLRKNELLATRTHMIIDLATRNVVVEFNQRGAKVGDIADLILRLAHRDKKNEGLTLEVVPMASNDFVEELAKFNRIRVATVELVQPNFSWDECEDAVLKQAEDSGASKVHLSFTATRFGTLSKSRGIIAAIGRFIKSGIHLTKKATITGYKEDSKIEETINLSKFVKKRPIKITRSPIDGHPEPKQILAEGLAYLQELSEENGE